jgi:hypothetical protein
MEIRGHPMHQTTVAKLESAARPTSVGEIHALALSFDVPVSDLFDFSDVAEIHWELASYANRLAVLANERTLLTLKIAKLEEEYAAAEAQHRKLQQQIAEMEDDEERQLNTRRKRKGR